MNALSPAQKERQRFARSRAGQIRAGIGEYLKTLGVIALAYQEQDHLTLGYDSWVEYVDEEFGADRLRLTPEHRAKAIEELRLGGLSQRAIATTLGVSRNTVAEQVAPGEPPVEVLGADGKTYSPARSPLVEAMTGAIEDAQERAQDHRADGLGEAANGAGTPAAAGAGVAAPAPAPDHRDAAPAEPGDEGATANAPEVDPSPSESALGATGPGSVMPPSGSGSPNLPAVPNLRAAALMPNNPRPTSPPPPKPRPAPTPNPANPWRP